jgi:hypothetical protein
VVDVMLFFDATFFFDATLIAGSYRILAINGSTF